MILLSSQMDLYYNLRNICLVVFAVFALINIIYGVRVHILTTILKHFGIEKRREMAKRREGAYKAGNSTAQMRYMQQTSPKTSGTMQKRQIDVSQVKTEKMQQEIAIRSVSSSMDGTMVLSAENQETVVLSAENQETVVLSAENQETVVLSAESQETVVLSPDNQDTVVLSPSERVIIRMQRNIIVVHGEDIT